MKKIKCPKSNSTDVSVDPRSIAGSPEEGYEVFPAHCVKGHQFNIKYILTCADDITY